MEVTEGMMRTYLEHIDCDAVSAELESGPTMLVFDPISQRL
jgi:hypothetical protein